MNLLITPKYQILDELTNIDSFLNITMSEDATEAVQRGMTWLYMLPVPANYLQTQNTGSMRR